MASYVRDGVGKIKVLYALQLDRACELAVTLTVLEHFFANCPLPALC